MDYLEDSTLKQELRTASAEPMKEESTSRIRFGYFNVQTTGYSRDEAEVCQISCMIGGEHYSVCIKPSGDIPYCVSRVTNRTMESDRLYDKGIKVETEPEEAAWNGLLEFLKHNGPVLLFGHRILGFHAVFMLKYFREYALLEKSLQHIVGFVDTLNLFKKINPHQKSYKLEHLVADKGIENFEAHNGPSINQALYELLHKTQIPYDTIVAYQTPFLKFIKHRDNLEEANQNKFSLWFLEDHGVSKYMIGKLAKAGLNYEKLAKFKAEGTLTENLQFVARDKTIIEKIRLACKA